MGLFTYFGKQYSYLRRYNQIIRVFFKYGFEDLVSYMQEKNRFNFFRKLIPKMTLQHATKYSKWEKMRIMCEELGPTFVKFGQLLSNRPDLLPAGLIKELEKLQDGVPPEPGKIAVSVIETELNGKTKELFSSFEEEAFASASMAQVHKAVLKTGERVVVKVQRPGIKETIENDIRVMKYVAEILLKRVPSIKSFDPIGLVRSFEESIIRELDFVNESINIQRFTSNFKESSVAEGGIYSPRIYADLTTSKVLTLEYIEGCKITDFEKLDQTDLDRKIIAERLANSYFTQIFDHGFFHADPHPGNFSIMPGNVICYLDYGMMGDIMKKDIEQLSALFIAVDKKDVRKIIRALQALSDNPVIRNFRQLEADINAFVQYHAFRTINKNEFSTVLLQLKDIIVKHKIKVPSHFFLLARALMTVEGLIHTLNPDIDLTGLAKPFLIKTAARHYRPLQFIKRILNSVYEMGMYMEEFPKDLKTAIRKINTGEIKVDLRHKGIDPVVHTIHRSNKLLISAMVLAALIISSTLMIVFKVHPWWGNTSAMGVIGFVVAGLIGFGMLRNLRKGDHDEWPGWDEE